MRSARVGNRAAKPRPAASGESPKSAVYLTEVLSEINRGASFLDRLSLEEIRSVRRAPTPLSVDSGESVFMQGDRHSGIYLIEAKPYDLRHQNCSVILILSVRCRLEPKKSCSIR